MYNDKSLPPRALLISTANATNDTEAIALVNELKGRYNLLAKSYNLLLAEKIIE